MDLAIRSYLGEFSDDILFIDLILAIWKKKFFGQFQHFIDILQISFVKILTLSREGCFASWNEGGRFDV